MTEQNIGIQMIPSPKTTLGRLQCTIYLQVTSMPVFALLPRFFTKKPEELLSIQILILYHSKQLSLATSSSCWLLLKQSSEQATAVKSKRTAKRSEHFSFSATGAALIVLHRIFCFKKSWFYLISESWGKVRYFFSEVAEKCSSSPPLLNFWDFNENWLQKWSTDNGRIFNILLFHCLGPRAGQGKASFTMVTFEKQKENKELQGRWCLFISYVII